MKKKKLYWLFRRRDIFLFSLRNSLMIKKDDRVYKAPKNLYDEYLKYTEMLGVNEKISLKYYAQLI